MKKYLKYQNKYSGIKLARSSQFSPAKTVHSPFTNNRPRLTHDGAQRGARLPRRWGDRNRRVQGARLAMKSLLGQSCSSSHSGGRAIRVGGAGAGPAVGAPQRQLGTHCSLQRQLAATQFHFQGG